MNIKQIIFFPFLIGFNFLHAQVSITGVATDFGGYFVSTNTNISSIEPNLLSNLLAFQVNGSWYSTGVNDTELTDQGLAYTVLDVAGLTAVGAVSNNIGQGSMDDGNVGTVTPIYNAPPLNGKYDVSAYMNDGVKGLGFSTFANNVGGTFQYSITGINPSFDGDGRPDLLYFNMAAPSNNSIQFLFFDSDGNQIGVTVSSAEDSHPNIARVLNDRYSFKNSQANATNKRQSVQGFTVELSDFSIPIGQHANIARLDVILPSAADPPFIGYNVPAIPAAPLLPVELSQFSTQNINGDVLITWETATEINNDFFEIQYSVDLSNWIDLARVIGMGTATETSNTPKRL